MNEAAPWILAVLTVVGYGLHWFSTTPPASKHDRALEAIANLILLAVVSVIAVFVVLQPFFTWVLE